MENGEIADRKVGTEPVKFTPAKCWLSQTVFPNTGPSEGKNDMTPGGRPKTNRLLINYSELENIPASSNAWYAM